ncbi:MAG: hypothetical protein Q8O10_04680 [candidate division Zixibacteria bacterium]|nr:hypothetical protein [candidate division Zixibacteria bacterium]
MKKIKYLLSIGFILIILSAAPLKTKAGGLSTQLGEVVIENLQIGQTYNLKQLANLQLIVTNTSDYGVDLRMDVLLPDKSELRKEAEPIPDISWVKLSQNLFKLSPNEKATSDIVLSIPDDDKYFGKKYQVTIWSHTLGSSGSGMFLAYGLNTRIIFTTDTVRATKSQVVTSSDASVNFTLKPEEIFLDNIELGKIYDVEKNTGLVLKITNPSKQKQTFKLQSLTVGNSVATLTKEYQDAPDASYLKFSDSSFVLPPKGTKTIKMYLRFPEEKEYTGKKYMFVLHAFTVDEKVTTGVYSRLYASIK